MTLTRGVRPPGDLGDLVRHGLLANGKVEKTRDTRHGPSHTVLSGFIGPNDKHATLITCWLVEDKGDRSFPKMTTTWVQPHKDKEVQP
jgi:hypothetical protein